MAITRKHEAEYSHWRPEEVKIIDGRAVRFSDVCVYEFGLGDVDDPDLYAGEPLWNWQKSEAGQWIMSHAVEEPYWIRHMDHMSFRYRYKVMARLSDQDQVFWKLKWGGLKK